MLQKLNVLIAVQDDTLRTQLVHKIHMHRSDIATISKDNGASTLLALNDKLADIAIIQDDLPLLNAFDVIEKYRSNSGHKTLFVLLSNQIKMEQFHKAKELNFSAFLSIGDIENDLNDCLDAVYQNNCYISNSMSMLISKFGQLSNKLASLSQTEKLFLSEINEGKNALEISEKLVLSNKSIKQLTTSIGKKLEIGTDLPLIKKWAKQHLTNFS